METIAVVCLIAGAALTSCSGSDSGNGLATDPDRVFSLCSFPAIAAGRVGTKIRIRGRLTSHAHGLLLSDERCPDVLVHLDIAPDAPDFCGPQLVQQFGCPPGAGEPFVTAVGVLTNATEPKNAVLLFNQLVDVERVPAEDQ